MKIVAQVSPLKHRLPLLSRHSYMRSYGEWRRKEEEGEGRRRKEKEGEGRRREEEERPLIPARIFPSSSYQLAFQKDQLQEDSSPIKTYH